MRQFELPVKLLGAKQVGFLTTESQTEYVVLSLIIVIVPHKKMGSAFQMWSKNQTPNNYDTYSICSESMVSKTFLQEVFPCGFWKKRKSSPSKKESSGKVCLIYKKGMKLSVFLFKYLQTISCRVPVLITTAITQKLYFTGICHFILKNLKTLCKLHFHKVIGQESLS